jgi:phage baseplate assembly protein W
MAIRNTRQFTDLNLMFTKHPATADVTKKIDEEAVKSSIRNLISTKNYERPFHPEIGCQIYSLLFENFNPITVQVMKRTIFQVIEKYEPRAQVLEVNLRAKPDDNEINIEIIFKIINTSRPVTLNAAISRIR